MISNFKSTSFQIPCCFIESLEHFKLLAIKDCFLVPATKFDKRRVGVGSTLSELTVYGDNVVINLLVLFQLIHKITLFVVEILSIWSETYMPIEFARKAYDAISDYRKINIELCLSLVLVHFSCKNISKTLCCHSCSC